MCVSEADVLLLDELPHAVLEGPVQCEAALGAALGVRVGFGVAVGRMREDG